MKIVPITIDQFKHRSKLYKQSKWIDLYHKLSLFGILNKNDEVIGEFLLQNVNMKGNKGLITPLFISNNCLEVDYPSDKTPSKIAFDKKIFQAFADFISKRKERIIDFSFPSNFKDMQSLQWKGIQVKPRYTYKLDLSKSEDELWNNLDTSTRANIKKAQDDGLIVEEGINSDLLSMTDKSFERQSQSYHRSFLNSIISSENMTNNRKVFVVKNQKTIYASILIVFDDLTAFYTIGGHDHEMNHRGAMASAMWNAIRFAKSNGNRSFDFQGSMLPGVEKFIRGFGGEINSYFRVSKVPFWIKLGSKLMGKEIGA